LANSTMELPGGPAVRGIDQEATLEAALDAGAGCCLIASVGS
jgi:hypothetical protein